MELEKQDTANKKNGKKSPVPIYQPISSFEDLKKRGAAENKKNKKKTCAPVTQPVFPPEIFIEILSWLPVKFLLRLMCVCKHWYAVIQDRHFIEKHMSRAIFTIIYNKIPKNSVASGTYQPICGCDGLEVERSNSTHKYCIWNPATRQFIELPDPHKGSFSIAFSYIPFASSYKLVSIYDDKSENSNECCEVLTLGSDHSWTPLKIPTIQDINKKWTKISVVCWCSCSLHSEFRIIEIGSSITEEVLSLDLGTEHFTTTLPRGQYRGWGKAWGLDWNGKLAIVDRMEGDLCVLVLEDYKKQKWGERKTVISSAFMKKLEEMNGDIVRISEQSDILWFWMKDERLFSYNIKNGCILKTITAPEGHRMSKKVYLCQQRDATRKEDTEPAKFKSGLRVMDHLR